MPVETNMNFMALKHTVQYAQTGRIFCGKKIGAGVAKTSYYCLSSASYCRTDLLPRSMALPPISTGTTHACVHVPFSEIRRKMDAISPLESIKTLGRRGCFHQLSLVLCECYFGYIVLHPLGKTRVL